MFSYRPRCQTKVVGVTAASTTAADARDDPTGGQRDGIVGAFVPRDRRPLARATQTSRISKEGYRSVLNSDREETQLFETFCEAQQVF